MSGNLAFSLNRNSRGTEEVPISAKTPAPAPGLAGSCLPHYRVSDAVEDRQLVRHLGAALKYLTVQSVNGRASEAKALAEKLSKVMPAENEPDLWLALNGMLLRNKSVSLAAGALNSNETVPPEDGCNIMKQMYLLGSAVAFAYLLRKDPVAADAAANPGALNSTDRERLQNTLKNIYHEFFKDNPELQVLLTPLNQKQPTVDTPSRILSGFVAPMLLLSRETFMDRLGTRFAAVNWFRYDADFSNLKRNPDNPGQELPITTADYDFLRGLAQIRKQPFTTVDDFIHSTAQTTIREILKERGNQALKNLITSARDNPRYAEVLSAIGSGSVLDGLGDDRDRVLGTWLRVMAGDQYAQNHPEVLEPFFAALGAGKIPASVVGDAIEYIIRLSSSEKRHTDTVLDYIFREPQLANYSYARYCTSHLQSINPEWLSANIKSKVFAEDGSLNELHLATVRKICAGLGETHSKAVIEACFSAAFRKLPAAPAESLALLVLTISASGEERRQALARLEELMLSALVGGDTEKLEELCVQAGQVAKPLEIQKLARSIGGKCFAERQTDGSADHAAAGLNWTNALLGKQESAHLARALEALVEPAKQVAGGPRIKAAGMLHLPDQLLSRYFALNQDSVVNDNLRDLLQYCASFIAPSPAEAGLPAEAQRAGQLLSAVLLPAVQKLYQARGTALDLSGAGQSITQSLAELAVPTPAQYSESREPFRAAVCNNIKGLGRKDWSLVRAVLERVDTDDWWPAGADAELVAARHTILCDIKTMLREPGQEAMKTAAVAATMRLRKELPATSHGMLREVVLRKIQLELFDFSCLNQQIAGGTLLSAVFQLADSCRENKANLSVEARAECQEYACMLVERARRFVSLKDLAAQAGLEAARNSELQAIAKYAQEAGPLTGK